MLPMTATELEFDCSTLGDWEGSRSLLTNDAGSWMARSVHGMEVPDSASSGYGISSRGT